MFTYAKASMNCKLCKIMCSLCIYSSCFAMFQGRGYSSWGQPSLRLLILDTAVTMSVGCSLAVFSTLLLACSNVFFVLQEFICTQSTWHWHCGSFLCFFCLMLCASSSYTCIVLSCSMMLLVRFLSHSPRKIILWNSFLYCPKGMGTTHVQFLIVYSLTVCNVCLLAEWLWQHIGHIYKDFLVGFSRTYYHV